MTRKELILGTISDSVLDLVEYDRRDDEELPSGSFEQALMAGEVTVDEMVRAFVGALMDAIPDAFSWQDSKGVKCSQCGKLAIQWAEPRKNFVIYRCTGCGDTYESGLNKFPVR